MKWTVHRTHNRHYLVCRRTSDSFESSVTSDVTRSRFQPKACTRERDQKQILRRASRLRAPNGDSTWPRQQQQRGFVVAVAGDAGRLFPPTPDAVLTKRNLARVWQPGAGRGGHRVVLGAGGAAHARHTHMHRYMHAHLHERTRCMFTHTLTWTYTPTHFQTRCMCSLTWFP